MTGEPIVVGPGAVAVARSVGPTAWTVLTALGLDSDWTGDSVLTLASVRSLGALLRLNKDTVARALGRLRDAGLVVHEAGCFERGVYRLTVPPEIIRFTIDLRTVPNRSRAHPPQSAAFQGRSSLWR